MNTENLTSSDITKLSNFRTGLRKYMTNSHLFCELFDLTDLQYVLLLNIKALEADKKASFAELRRKLNFTAPALNMVINRSLKSNLLESYSPANADSRHFRLSNAGNKVIETLALLHKKEFESFQSTFVADCSTHCTSPVCWKGTD